MGGYAYAADNPVTNADPTGQIAVGPSGTSCSTGTEYLSWCAGSGSDGGINGDGGTASGTSTGTDSPTNPGSPRHHRPDFAVAVAQQIADGQLSDTGNWLDFLAGLGSVPAGLADIAACEANLLACGQLAVSGDMPSALYANWVRSHGIDTSMNSTYGNGAAFATLLTSFLGDAAAAAAGAAANTTDEAGAAVAASGAGGSASVAESSESGLSKAFQAMAEEGKDTGDTIGAAHDVAGGFGTSADDLFGHDPSAWTAMVDAGGGSAPPADYGPSYPNLTGGSAGGFEAAAFIVSMTVAGIGIVIKRAFG
jgi:hypothetical protein